MISDGMETLAGRLASFSVAHPIAKKRSSNAKGSKSLKWPHENPTPSEVNPRIKRSAYDAKISKLAKAGFYYRPTSSEPDNAQCFLCHCNLDGWEEEDNAISEHLKVAPDCAWATIAAIEQDIEDGAVDQEDPMSEKLLEARKLTFGVKWPHEAKKGWACKTQKVVCPSTSLSAILTKNVQMIEAGWYYCPTPECDDYAKCPYCDLSLDGWEPKDNP